MSGDEDFIIKIRANDDGGCLLAFGSDISLEIVMNSLISALYTISRGPDSDDHEFARYIAENYVTFVKDQERKSKMKPTLTLVR